MNKIILLFLMTVTLAMPTLSYGEDQVDTVPVSPSVPSESTAIPGNASSREAVTEPAKQSTAVSAEEDKNKITLQAGQRLNLKIFPDDEYIKGGEMEISAEGNVTLPLAGKIHVVGMSVSEAEKKIVQIIDADYLVNPEVVIELKRSEEKEVISTENFLVLGEVKKPGTYAIPVGGKNKFTLLHAISLAGGFTEVANPKRIKLVRKAGGQRQTMAVNVEEIFNGNSPDIEMKNGDVIHVPESLF